VIQEPREVKPTLVAKDGRKFVAVLKPFAEVPISSSTCLALDMVLTITADPAFYSAIAAQLKQSGGRLIVIVSRPSEERSSTVQELARYGLQYDEVIFLPPIEEAVRECPYRDELGYYGSYLWNKVHIAELAGVTHYVGQDPLVRDLFRRFLPGVTVHYPRELYPRDAFDPVPSKIAFAGAQGIIDTIEVDFSTDPPTYRLHR
jgi:hypothetical protein